jgi:hypothetical protein
VHVWMDLFLLSYNVFIFMASVHLVYIYLFPVAILSWHVNPSIHHPSNSATQAAGIPYVMINLYLDQLSHHLGHRFFPVSIEITEKFSKSQEHQFYRLHWQGGPGATGKRKRKRKGHHSSASHARDLDLACLHHDHKALTTILITLVYSL